MRDLILVLGGAMFIVACLIIRRWWIEANAQAKAAKMIKDNFDDWEVISDDEE